MTFIFLQAFHLEFTINTNFVYSQVEAHPVHSVLRSYIQTYTEKYTVTTETQQILYTQYTLK